MCFKALRTSFRTKNRRPGPPAHQAETQLTPPANSLQPHTPDRGDLAANELRKSAEALPDALQGVPSPGEDNNDQTATEDTPHLTTSDWKTTTWNATKLTLHLVKEAADAFPPLKAVAGGLCELISNFEVRICFYKLIHN